MCSKQLNIYEIISKHDREDTCSICHGFYEVWTYNYEEIYKRYVGHLRHLHVYDYLRDDKRESYKNFVLHCQYNGLFEKNAQTLLWKISVDQKYGYLIISKFD